MLSASAPQTLEFDHLGLIVPDLAAGRAFLESALGIDRWTPVTDDPGLRVSVQFGSAQSGSVQSGSSPSAAFGPHASGSHASGLQIVYELIAPLGENSPIAGALRQNKSILNHVAYLTPSLVESAAHLRGLGCFATGDPQPAVAYSGCLIQFWVSPLRFIIELIEKPGHRHLLEAAPAQTAPAASTRNREGK